MSQFSVFDNYVREVTIDNHKNVRLCLWDTAGQEAYDRLRPLSYPNTDLFLLCFAVDAPNSLHNVQTKWIPELKFHNKKAKIILVGLKQDLRCGAKDHPVDKKCIPRKMIKKVAKNINVAGFLECSAKTQDGLYNLFDFVIKLLLTKNNPFVQKWSQGTNVNACSIS